MELVSAPKMVFPGTNSGFLLRSPRGFQDLEINEVLGSSGRTFVSNQFRTSDHWNGESFQIHHNLRFRRIFKLDTADPRHQVNSSWWQTNLVNGVGFLEILNGDPVFCNRGPEFIERSENPLTVFSTRSDPDIEVAGVESTDVV